MEPAKAQDMVYRCIDLIENPEIKKFTLKGVEAAHPKFWTSHTSSSGKYHPPENNLDGGLAGVHTPKVVIGAINLAEHQCPEQTDIVISGSIFHDICKGIDENGEWGKYHSSDHAFKAYKWLEQFDLAPNYKEPIREAVRTHMSDLTEPKEEWEYVKRLMQTKKLSVPQMVVQSADVFASMMGASYIPGINVLHLIRMHPRNHTPEQIMDDIADLGSLERAIDYLWKNKW